MSEILHIDALKGFKNLADESFDIVLTDPPYNIGKDFGNNKDDLSFEDYLVWSKKWLDESVRCLKQSGTMYIYGFDEILAHISVMLPVSNVRWLTWFYTNKTVPRCKWFNRSHESIICFWKDKDQRVFNLDNVREPYTDIFLKNAAGKVRKNTKGRFGTSEGTIYTANEKGAMPRDVLRIDDVIECGALAGGKGKSERWFYSKSKQEAFPGTEMKHFTSDDIIQHPTQKPYDLTERLLKAAMPKDGNVLIPFFGSGSEGAVCDDLKLNYTAFEMNGDYVAMAKSFLSKRTKKH
jgi:site-specific DNA-methyltransferase (adenine-specific)